MEDYIEILTDKKFRCPLCQELLPIKFDKRKQKPYCQCNACGMQLFIRREKGIEILIDETKGLFEW